MSHQRYPSHDPIKEPHAISLKVLRLSRPSLVAQHPLPLPLPPPSSRAPPIPASLAYDSDKGTNPEPFILSPILSLPPSFGSAYVGETFSCTLCANHDVPDPAEAPSAYPGAAAPPPPAAKHIRDVRIEAEMKTPSSAHAVKLDLTGGDDEGAAAEPSGKAAGGGVDLEPGRTLQKIVNFDLKEEGNHVLAVTVSYYEATDTSGRTRTFRKLYQFICKASLIVRTKAGPLPAGEEGGDSSSVARRWVLEAQLENCSEDAIQLEKVVMEVEAGLGSTDCNWEVGGGAKPVLHPGEVEQVCFLVEEKGEKAVEEVEGRIVFGVLGIGWRSEMGNRGYLSTGKLGTRHGK
ncbi:Trafficking protein particle complex subunit 13 [Pleurostoma richardsiae]|uniref:Trafficking protein particle complex subunit 13 n=1 Tax=Pleurostoma richardsiae TaxID=41990 RepID=A0AA38RJT6_9PEZI|nr:Trafficking protein particle complex subunit 13 [Pleurostoma richardsiae]